MAKKAVKDKKSAKVSAPSKKSPAKATKTAAKKSVPAKKATLVKKEVKKAAPAKKAAPTKKVAPAKKAAPSKSVAKPTVKKTVSKTVAKPAVEKVAPTKAVKTAPKVVVPVKVKPVAKAASPVAKKPTPAQVEKAKPTGKPKGRRKKSDDDDDDDDAVVVPPPPPKIQREKSTLPKRNPGRSAGDELTLEGPAPKKISPIDITSSDRVKLKKDLLNRCLEIQKANVNLAKKAMEEAMKSANEEKVSEEMSDSFRENMHATRDMYARQVQEGLNNIGLLNRIMIQEHDRVKFGSVVFTNFQNYFISTGLGEIKSDDKSFLTVSTLSPLFQILADKRKGDTFMFLDRLYTVIEVF
jgi:hypothetical protein